MLKANESLHLLVEISGVDSSLLDNSKYLNTFLNETPGTISMTLAIPAEVSYIEAEDHIDRGWSGSCILVESHCALHSFPERGFMFMDIFSCKLFNHYEVLTRIHKLFNPTSMHISLTNRGKLMDDYLKEKKEQWKLL